MINSFNNFYNNLSSDGIFFFWVVIFLFLFLIVLTIILVSKNKKLIKLLKEEVDTNSEENTIPESIITSNDVVEDIKINNLEEEKNWLISNNREKKEEPVRTQEIPESAAKPKEEIQEKSLYQKNVLREMSGREQTSPIHIEKKEDYVARETLEDFDFSKYDNGLGMSVEDASISPLEDLPDYYEVNDNMKFASEIVDKMEEEMKPSNIELTDFEKKQEEEAIISYDELLKVKDKIYNITEDEETDEFIDELKNFRLDLK